MKIENKKINNNIKFKELNVGDTFYSGGYYYIKCEITRKELFEDNRLSSIWVNSLNLISGRHSRFNDDFLVKKIEIEAKAEFL